MDSDQGPNVKIVAGLGNPGRKYERTRHNLGFMVIEQLVRNWRLEGPRKAFDGLVYDARVTPAGETPADDRTHRQRVLLLQPNTFMNRSGQAVKALATFYKVHQRDILIVLDDMSLPPGRLRIRRGGSAGGHKGLASVTAMLATERISRLRIGIGPPPQFMDAVDFVLRRFEPDEIEIMQQAVALAARVAEQWLLTPINELMTRYNGTTQKREKPNDEE